MLKITALLLCVAVISASGDDKVVSVKEKSVSDELVKPAPTSKPVVQVVTEMPAIVNAGSSSIKAEILPSNTSVSASAQVEDHPQTTVPPKINSTPESSKQTEPINNTTVPSNPNPESHTNSSSTSNSPTKPTPTPAPKTTTAPPKTTTEAPKTTTAAPKTTTGAPTTAPTPTPTPAPAPTPIPHPETGKWIVNNTKQTCIVAQMAVKFNVSYTVNKTETHKVVVIPAGNASSTATGNCGLNEQNMTISWKSPGVSNDSFTIHFVKNETTKQYSLHHFEVLLAPKEVPGYNKSMLLVHNASHFTTGLTNSYRCLRFQNLNLTLNGTDKVVGYLTVSDLQFQAFRSENSTVFGLAKDCAFDAPDIVPIAVGCALAGLVVIILISYLVGRRRSQAQGYVSM